MRDQRGFTLLELMIVVTIVAILNAIVVPTFLSAKSRAQNTEAQANLRNEFTEARIHWTDTGTFEGFDSKLVEVRLASDTTVVLSALSSSGEPFCFADDVNRGTVEGVGDVDTWDACDAAPDW